MSERKKILYEPISISTYDRNGRLLKTLLDMGLAVVPMFDDSEARCISYFLVSCGAKPLMDYGQDQG